MQPSCSGPRLCRDLSVFSRLRSHIALVLLLAFGRVLLPDAALLALHRHTHTAREAAHQVPGFKGKVLLTERHTHCATDHLFSAPALPAPVFAFGVVVPVAYEKAVSTERAAPWPARLVATLNLRGPPAKQA